MRDDCTVVVNSCDRYEEVWPPFFALFSRYWPDCALPVVLNTESKDYSYPSVSVRTVNSAAESWSGRLLSVVSRVRTPFVLLVMDDFFLQRRVKSESIYRLLDLMTDEPGIGAIYLKRIFGSELMPSEYDGLCEMRRSGRYLVNFQAGLWNREALETLVLPGATPWEIEIRRGVPGAERWQFLCPAEGEPASCDNDIFPYICAVRSGYGISKSSWLWRNEELFRREGIERSVGVLPTVSKWRFWAQHYRAAVGWRVKESLGRRSAGA